MLDYVLLQAELADDPSALGYNGSDVGDADRLNAVRQTVTLNRESIPMSEVYGHVVWGDFVTLSAAARQAFQLITSTDVIDARSQQIRDAFVAIFGAGSPTLQNLAGILTRTGSRAEELFGAGVRVTPSDVANARRV